MVKGNYKATYVLVHGAWHTGAELQDVAAAIQAVGHEVHTPTTKGNRPVDSKRIGSSEAISSIVEYLEQLESEQVIIVGHTFGGMVITGVADRIPHRLRRLVYWDAFVPNDERVLDLVADRAPRGFVRLEDAIPAKELADIVGGYARLTGLANPQ